MRSRRIFSVLFFCCLFFSLTAQQPKITYKVLQDSAKTWGYDIEIDKKLAIHQPHIPGMPGNSGFKTKAAAESVAKLVVSKIKKGETPPTVTIDELKKLKAI